ncbi:MAG TPA: EamA/RhaT family transporter [Rhizobium sp.]|nr:EamA/RhaT family transporter [Rhizobium sp.]
MAYASEQQRTGLPKATGYLAAFLTVVIWAVWVLATRYGRQTQIGAIELGLLRFGIPAIVLAPVWIRAGLIPKGVPRLTLFLMVCGSGAPFFHVAAFALHFAPASAAGVLMVGAMPLATALIGILVFRERPDAMRLAGIGAIVVGILILLSSLLTVSDIAWQGYVLLPIAATFWAIYTHAFRRSGLGALEGSALIAIWSLLIHIVLVALFGIDLSGITLNEIGIQVVAQGLLSGLAATIAFGIAVRSLGSMPAAAFAALVPVMAALGGGLLLGEQIGPMDFLAAIVTGAGVALSTGILSPRK